MRHFDREYHLWHLEHENFIINSENIKFLLNGYQSMFNANNLKNSHYIFTDQSTDLYTKSIQNDLAGFF